MNAFIPNQPRCPTPITAEMIEVMNTIMSGEATSVQGGTDMDTTPGEAKDITLDLLARQTKKLAECKAEERQREIEQKTKEILDLIENLRSYFRT